MKAKLSRLFFGALMFVTMCATAPVLPASAEEQTLKTKEFSKEAEVVKENEDNKFSSFAELKDIIENIGAGYYVFSYNGTEALVIEEDITIPQNLKLLVEGVETIIPAGVTLTVEAYEHTSIFDRMKVQGTLELQDVTVEINEILDVQGKVINGGHIVMDVGATLSGKEKIEYIGEEADLIWVYMLYSVPELKEVIAIANQNLDQTNWEYQASLGNVVTQEEISIGESLLIPQNLELCTLAPITIETGCTVELTGPCQLAGALKVKGTLINPISLRLDYQVVYSSEFRGMLDITEGGTYSGRGDIYIYCNPGTDYKNAVLGLDLNKFEVTGHMDKFPYYWELSNVEHLIQLGTPTDLEWGVRRYQVFNSETETWEWVKQDVPGHISWKPAAPDQGRMAIKIYKEGKTNPYKTYYDSVVGNSELPEYYTFDRFINDDPESGTYYFTVTSLGDYTQYRDSETVVSGTWTYIKPDAQIGTSKNVSWNWPFLTYESPADDTYVGGFEVEIYNSTTLDGEKQFWSSACVRNCDCGSDYHTMGLFVQGAPAGYYYARVRALSNDITKECNGAWSDWSEPYYLPDGIEEINNELNAIIDNAETADEIREAVQKIDKEELKIAMEADQGNGDTVAKIQVLEEKVGGAAPVDVTEDAAAFGEGGVSVVGANLNNSASETDPITLVIDKPEKDNVIPEAYDNSVAVRFNMTLDNVEDPENLAVPVKITMPVPSTINPQFLVVLHYHAATDEVEEIRPHVYRGGSQYYASFVLTSFSDFVMTQDADAEEVNPFADVPEDQWYYPYVKKAWQNGLMSGVSTTEDGLVVFAPETLMTRAMFVQVLYGIHGKPAVEYTAKFEDVPSGQWYTSAVLWAAENGITSGVSATNFGVNQNITREQMALMLMKYAELIGADVSGRANMDGFVDWESVSSWAKDAMQWAVENGVMSGEAGGKLNPQGKANRAVGATMFNAFYEKFTK